VLRAFPVFVTREGVGVPGESEQKKGGVGGRGERREDVREGEGKEGRRVAKRKRVGEVAGRREKGRRK
jgi:hypothetical protein